MLHLFLVVLVLLLTSLPSALSFHIFSNDNVMTGKWQSARHTAHLPAPPANNLTFTDCGNADSVVRTITDPKQSFLVNLPPFYAGAWTFTVKSTISTAVIFSNGWYNGAPADTWTYDWVPGLRLSSTGQHWARLQPLTPDTYTYVFSQWTLGHQSGAYNMTNTVVDGTGAEIGCLAVRWFL